MEEKENIIGFDFQGWPIYKKALRELLVDLGATFVDVGKDGFLGFNANDPILDKFPTTLEDDGMGYGIKEMYITDADYDEKSGLLHIWRDIQQPDFKGKMQDLIP